MLRGVKGLWLLTTGARGRRRVCRTTQDARREHLAQPTGWINPSCALRSWEALPHPRVKTCVGALPTPTESQIATKSKSKKPMKLLFARPPVGEHRVRRRARTSQYGIPQMALLRPNDPVGARVPVPDSKLRVDRFWRPPRSAESTLSLPSCSRPTVALVPPTVSVSQPLEWAAMWA